MLMEGIRYSDYPMTSSEIRALELMKIYAEELGIEKKITDHAERLFIEVKMKFQDEIFNNVVFTAVCLITIIKRNSIAIKSKDVIDIYRGHRHRISQKVLNRITMDYSLKSDAVDAKSFVKHYLENLIASPEIKNRIALRDLDENLYWETIESTTLCFLSYLTNKYQGGSPPSILSAFAIYLSDRILKDSYTPRSVDNRAVLSKKLVSKYTNAKIDRSSSQIITKLNKYLEKYGNLIKREVGIVDIKISKDLRRK